MNNNNLSLIEFNPPWENNISVSFKIYVEIQNYKYKHYQEDFQIILDDKNFPALIINWNYIEKEKVSSSQEIEFSISF